MNVHGDPASSDNRRNYYKYLSIVIHKRPLTSSFIPHILWGEKWGMMKPVGRHPEKALTAVKVRSLTKPGRYGDGNGLYLIVDPSNAKRWMLRTVVRGRRRDIGLGGVQLVSLAEARETAVSYRKIARSGGDPLEERRRAAREIPTFEEAARQVHATHQGSWKNAKHAQQWINTLTRYTFPTIGMQRVDQIGAPEILNVLSPIWLTKPETARRVRQRIGTVLDWAKTAGHRSGENPIAGIGKGLPKQPVAKKHHAALPYDEVPGFVARLRESGLAETTRMAFEFLILTAGRTGEVVGARWEEVNLEDKIWTVPAARMKAGREHRVPLSSTAFEILRRAELMPANTGFIFPGQKPEKPISNMAFLMALRRMMIPVTAHGFRSTFRDWAAERTSFPREVCEMALAHTIRDKSEAAYRRGDLLEKRRDLMEAWSRFVSSTAHAVVVPLKAGKR